MKKYRTQPCRKESPREDPFYGTRFREYVLIALAIMVNAFLIGFGLTRLDPDGGWLKMVIGIAAATFWVISLLAALFLIIGTYVQIRICLTHRRNKRNNIDNTTNNSAVNH